MIIFYDVDLQLVSHLQTRIAVLEQEVRDKEKLLERSNELLHSQQESKVGCFFKKYTLFLVIFIVEIFEFS